MKRLTMVILLLMLTLSGYVNAQTEIPNKPAGSLAKGSYAIEFQISDNFRFTSFQGGLLSLKRYLSDTKAIRYGVSLMLNHQDNYDKYITSPADSIHGSRRITSSNILLDLYYSRLTYLPAKNSIHFYYGLGLTFEFNHNYFDNTKTRDYYRSWNSWALGPIGLLGVEWFPHPDISLSGEYSIIGTATYTHALVDDYIPGIGRVSVKRNAFAYSLAQQSVKLGVSVYF